MTSFITQYHECCSNDKGFSTVTGWILQQTSI